MKLIPLTIATLFALPAVANAQVLSDVRAYGKSCGDIQILPDHALIGQNWSVTTKSKDATRGLIAFGIKRANRGQCCVTGNDFLAPRFSENDLGIDHVLLRLEDIQRGSLPDPALFNRTFEGELRGFQLRFARDNRNIGGIVLAVG